MLAPNPTPDKISGWRVGALHRDWSPRADRLLSTNTRPLSFRLLEIYMMVICIAQSLSPDHERLKAFGGLETI